MVASAAAASGVVAVARGEVGTGGEAGARGEGDVREAGFELLDHPADMGFSCWGPSLDAMFVEAGKALLSTLTDLDKVASSEVLNVELESSDQEGLMYSWLSELLYLFDGEKLIVSQFSVAIKSGAASSSSSWKLKAELQGERYDPERHQINTYVKAVTFHQMEIRRHGSRYSAQVFLDI